MVAALGASCGSGYEYVENRDERLFLKIPAAWESFPVELTGDAGTESGESGQWMEFIDGGPEPSPGNFGHPDPSHPAGFAEIKPLGTDERDTVDFEFLRAAALDDQGDPFELAETSDDVTVSYYEEITNADGFRGNRIILAVQSESGPLTIDHLAMVDPATTRMYRLVVQCSSACYSQNEGQIDGVFSSWTLEER